MYKFLFDSVKALLHYYTVLPMVNVFKHKSLAIVRSCANPPPISPSLTCPHSPHVPHTPIYPVPCPLYTTFPHAPCPSPYLSPCLGSCPNVSSAINKSPHCLRAYWTKPRVHNHHPPWQPLSHQSPHVATVPVRFHTSLA
jgi:hypothetical protein